MPQENLQLFGGDWTEQKLRVLSKYLRAYTTALKKTPFRTAYIDAFAGTGYRELREQCDGSPLLFNEIADPEPQQFLDGSVRIALKVEPAFDSFAFIESDDARAVELEGLRAEFPSRAERINVWKGDANALLQDWCSKHDWRNWRAVLFLDPFGMQVDWDTMTAVARTCAIDVWILFPLGMAVNRLLTRDPSRMPDGWRRRLNRMFGSDDWYATFYRETESPGLLGPRKETRKVCTLEVIGSYYLDKLRGLFGKVADNPLYLRNATGNPIFQLHFAASNRGRGGELAVKIAQDILGKL